MPIFVALIFSQILALLFIVTPITNPFVRLGLRLWYVGACVDFLYGTARGLIGGCKDGVDWSKFLLESGMSSGAFAALTWFLWSIILAHFIWVFWAYWGRHPARSVGFWEFRPFVCILICLSLFAVILPAAMSDDSIKKDNAAFWIPYIVQILALAWYVTYFVLTFTRKGKSGTAGS
ncbi:MAG: hypothetical protein ACYTGZ_07920 [Planctomycetota bacterium]